MGRYRCILIGAPGHMETFEFECRADADAVLAGRHVLADDADHQAFELWCGSRRVHVELRETAGKKIERPRSPPRMRSSGPH